MTAIENDPYPASSIVDKITAQVLEVFPSLEPDARRVAVHLYRLLAKGGAVSQEELAQAAEVSAERVNEILANWPAVYFEEDKIIGFWGLTPRPLSKHLLKFDGRTAYAWCAWDTLFIPEIIGQTVKVESTDPQTEAVVRLTVTPDEVKNVSPAGSVMSMMTLTADMTEDIVAKFCDYVYFFPSEEAGKQWVAKNPGTSLMSIEDSFELAKRRNRGQFKEALDIPVE